MGSKIKSAILIAIIVLVTSFGAWAHCRNIPGVPIRAETESEEISYQYELRLGQRMTLHGVTFYYLGHEWQLSVNYHLFIGLVQEVDGQPHIVTLRYSVSKRSGVNEKISVGELTLLIIDFDNYSMKFIDLTPWDVGERELMSKRRADVTLSFPNGENAFRIEAEMPRFSKLESLVTVILNVKEVEDEDVRVAAIHIYIKRRGALIIKDTFSKGFFVWGEGEERYKICDIRHPNLRAGDSFRYEIPLQFRDTGNYEVGVRIVFAYPRCGYWSLKSVDLPVDLFTTVFRED
jgi:hypothetical protein